MELDWTTAALEALNFLVLVWLLKHFFYRPVLNVIEARKAASERIVADAQATRRDADAMKEEYARKLADAGKEREQALARLAAEIASERSRRLEAVATEAEADRQRRAMLDAREARERAAALEREAVTIAARFATRLVERLAGPELEAKLVDLALADLAAQTPQQLATLSAALRDPAVAVEVITAYPLDAPRREVCVAALHALGSVRVPTFREDATLKSGLRLTAGAWVLMANLRDDLAFFTGALEHGS